MNVDQLIEETIENEGHVFTNDPSDSGGPTKFGITQRTLSVYLHHPASIEDVKNLTIEQARIIYKSLYYYGPRFDLLPEPLQAVIYDWGVNSGPGAAVEALQTVLTMAKYECKCDGILGPATVKVAECAYEQMRGYLINAICEYRVWFYNTLAENRPKDRKYLRGWLLRANRFRVSV